MQRKFYLVMTFIVVASVLPSALTSAGARIKREFEVGPLRMSYRVLDEILTTTRNFTDSAGHDELTLASGEESISLTQWRSILDIRELPPVANEVRYSLHNFESGSGIQRVELELYNHRRTIRIEGTNPEKITGLTLLLKQKLQKHTVVWATVKFKLVVHSILLLACILVLVFFSKPTRDEKGEEMIVISRIALPVGVALVIGAFLVLFVFDPKGVVVTANEVGFVTRHGALFSLLGLVVAVLLPISAWVLRRWRLKV